MSALVVSLNTKVCLYGTELDLFTRCGALWCPVISDWRTWPFERHEDEARRWRMSIRYQIFFSHTVRWTEDDLKNISGPLVFALACSVSTTRGMPKICQESRDFILWLVYFAGRLAAAAPGAHAASRFRLESRREIHCPPADSAAEARSLGANSAPSRLSRRSKVTAPKALIMCCIDPSEVLPSRSEARQSPHPSFF